MIKGLIESSNNTSLIEGKIKIGVSVIKIPNTEIDYEEDTKGNKIPYVTYNNETYEYIGKTTKGEMMIRVNKENFPNAFMMSLPYFILPPQLENIYGKRASTIKIVFKSNDLEDIIPNELKKYNGSKQIICHGDGEKANRFDEEKEIWINGITCPCAYFKHFQEAIITEVPFSDSLTKRTIQKYNRDTQKNEDVREILVQGAWRSFNYNKETKICHLNPIKPSCEVRYSLRFICPELEGINLYQLEGGGLKNLTGFINSLQGIKSLAGKIAGIPLYLKVRMEEQNIKNVGKRKYPRVYLHLPYSLDQLFDNAMKEHLLSGTKPLQIEDSQEINIEDIEAIDTEEIG